MSTFPQIPQETWRARVWRGVVHMSDGTVVDERSPYRHGMFVLYQREVECEPPAAEEETLVYQDDEILVADKPSGMPVTPAGEYVDRSLLARLQQRTGIEALAPLHRLDRDTVGLVLFSVRPETRGRYHALFAERAIEREYVAHAKGVPEWRRLRVENRLAAGDPWFVQQVVDGPVNAITEIEWMDGWFRLRPETGKKHQLRVHMAGCGFPILGDSIYGDGVGPLQLVAVRLAFVDPLSGHSREFVSPPQQRRGGCAIKKK